MKKRKIKRRLNKNFYIVVFILIALIVGLSFIIKDINYKKTYDYKLYIRGYTPKVILVLKKELSDKEIDAVLKLEFITYIDKLISEKYFLFKHLNDYIRSYKDETNFTNLVAMVNTNTNLDYYSNVKKTDISKKELMLVNKYNILEASYKPANLVNIKNWYSYGENSSEKIVYDMFVNMHEEAKKKDLFIIVNSSYRSYELQQDIYDLNKEARGSEYADAYVAHPGHSEHQTGYTLDLSNGVAIEDEFEDTDEFRWLVDNAYKYGFILRYPKEKEHLTGFSYESWHYRYVGAKTATKVKELGITYDEYYAYYLDK